MWREKTAQAAKTAQEALSDGSLTAKIKAKMALDDSVKALDLNVNQVNALLAWLYGGGHLIVGVEQIIHLTGNDWLRRLEGTGRRISRDRPSEASANTSEAGEVVDLPGAVADLLLLHADAIEHREEQVGHRRALRVRDVGS